LEALRKEFEQTKETQNDYVALKTSFNEIDVKKQLTVYKEFVVSKHQGRRVVLTL
jgi:hypothetical protein